MLVSSSQVVCHILFCLRGSSFPETRFWSCRCLRWLWGWSGPPGPCCSTATSSVVGIYRLLLFYILAATATFMDHFTLPASITSFPNLDFLTKANTPFNLKIQPLQPSLIAAKFKTIHPHHVKGK